MDNCSAFQFVNLPIPNDAFACTLYGKDRICQKPYENSVEIYADQNEELPLCAGNVISIIILKNIYYQIILSF